MGNVNFLQLKKAFAISFQGISGNHAYFGIVHIDHSYFGSVHPHIIYELVPYLKTYDKFYKAIHLAKCLSRS